MTATKTNDKFAAAQELKAAEREFRAKYPKAGIVQGTLRPGAKEGFGNKRVVTIRCRCGAKRTVATSDVFHIKGCEECTRKLRNAARAASSANGKPTKKGKK